MRSASRCAEPYRDTPHWRATRPLAVLLLGLGLVLVPAPTLAAACDYRAEPIALEIGDQHRLQAELRIPQGEHRPLPAVMIFGGLDTSERVLDLLPAIDEAVVLATFAYPFEPPEEFRMPQALALLPAARAAVFDTLSGIGQLHEALAAHPAVDPARITVVGASLGAPFAVVAAERHDIPGLVAVQGFGDLREVIAHQFARRWEPRYGRLGTAVADILGWALSSYAGLPAPERRARKLKRNQKVLMISARNDRIIPATASAALWHALQASAAQVTRLETEGGHLHSGADALILDLLEKTMAWKQEQGML